MGWCLEGGGLNRAGAAALRSFDVHAKKGIRNVSMLTARMYVDVVICGEHNCVSVCTTGNGGSLVGRCVVVGLVDSGRHAVVSFGLISWMLLR